MAEKPNVRRERLEDCEVGDFVPGIKALHWQHESEQQSFCPGGGEEVWHFDPCSMRFLGGFINGWVRVS